MELAKLSSAGATWMMLDLDVQSVSFFKVMIFPTVTVDREIFYVKNNSRKKFALINFLGSIRSSKFFCVKCFIRVLNFHSWSQL